MADRGNSLCHSSAGEGSVTDKLIRLVLQDGSDTIYGVKYRAVDLLKCFLEQVFSLPLEEGKTVDGSMVKELVITVPKMKARLMDGLMYCADPVKDSKSSCSCDQPHRGVHVFCAEPDQGCVEQSCGII